MGTFRLVTTRGPGKCASEVLVQNSGEQLPTVLCVQTSLRVIRFFSFR